MLGLSPIAGAPIAGAGQPLGGAVFTLNEAADTMAAAANVILPATMAATEHPDTMVAAATVAAGGARATQVLRRALVQTQADDRTTAVVRRALVKDGGIPTRITTVVRRALVYEEVQNKVTAVVRRALVAVVPCTTRWTRVWTITRVDGVTYRFTALDHDLIYGGHTYLSCGSLTPSASEASNVAGEFAQMQLQGVISAEGIAQEDLDAGRLDSAKFEEWEVPYDGSPESPHLMQRGRWGRVEYSAERGYDVEVLGDGALLQQAPLVKPYTPGCRWDDNIRDARCPVSADLVPFTVTGTVEDGLGARSFMDSARTEAADYFAFGTITFTSGDNAGVTAEVRANQDGVFTLWPRLASPIAAGDDYTMVAGCDQLKATCQDKFNAYIGFGGFKDVPGQDALQQSPTAH